MDIPDHTNGRGRKSPLRGTLFLFTTLAVVGNNALSAPQDAAIVAGSASVTTEASVTTITQQTDKAILNWRSFDIDASEQVIFNQPSSSSATLNRILSGQASLILGQLDSNGQILLINPNGIIFGQDSQVNVGSLIATTSSISNDDFIAGDYSFSAPSTHQATITNDGEITAADGGLIALVAPHVSNNGIISARLGKVALASGNKFTIDLYGDGLISFLIDESHVSELLSQGAVIDNSGTINVAGGTAILMTAQSGSTLIDNVINIDGIISANNVAESRGEILLTGEDATVNVSGQLSARSDASATSGGLIEILSNEVHLSDNANIDVSGHNGGGTIHIGGRYQGAGPYTSTLTTVSEDVQLSANAMMNGDGGEVILWSDEHTSFKGAISARGGQNSGNGGFVEVSGKQTLDFLGYVDAGADNGNAGTLLLDPAYLTIGLQEASLINYVMRAGTTPILQATVDITIDSMIDGRGLYEGGGITMSAGNDINLNNYIVTNNGDVTLNAAGGTVNVASGYGVFSGNGDIAVSAGGSLVDSPYITTGSLNLTSTTSSINILNGISAGIGDLNLNAFADINVAAPITNISNGSTLQANAGNDINVNALIDGTGGTSGGVINLTASGDINVNEHIVSNDGTITLSAGGTVSQLADGVDADGLPLTKQVRSGSAAISVSAGGNLSPGSLVTTGALSVQSGGDMTIDVPIYETTGNTTLTAGGDLIINQPVANTTSGSDLVMTARGDITVNTEVGPWDGATGTIRTSAIPGGSITLQSASNINVNEDIVSYDGPISLYAGVTTSSAADCASPPCTVTLADGKQIRSGSGTLSVTAYSDLTNGPVPFFEHDDLTTGFLTTGNLNITSTTGDVILQQAILETTGETTIRGGNAVLLTQRLYTNNSNINIYAGSGGFSASGADDIDAGTADIWLEAVGDISDPYLAAQNISVRSTAGTVSNLSIHGGTPNKIEIAGYSGINSTSVQFSTNIDLLSVNGSVTNTGVDSPNSLRIIAKDNITNIYGFLGNEELYAGKDISFMGNMYNSITAKAGGNLTITSSGDLVAVGGQLDLSAGYNPFNGLTGLTVAGVSAPSAWSQPASSGNITIGTLETDRLYAGDLTINASNNVSLPRMELGALTVNAGDAATIQQIFSIDSVAITTTNGDINLATTVGAHVAPGAGLWNPTNLGVADLSLLASNANINMYEARAEGDITIAAPNGQVNFLGVLGLSDVDGLMGIESTGGAVSVTDSDGVSYTSTIDTTEVSRLGGFGVVSPTVPPGPTILGPGAPVVAGALPPGAPGGATVTDPSAPGSSGNFLTEIDISEPDFDELENTALASEDSNTDKTSDSQSETELLAMHTQSFEEQTNPLSFTTTDGVFVIYDDEEGEAKRVELR